MPVKILEKWSELGGFYAKCKPKFCVTNPTKFIKATQLFIG